MNINYKYLFVLLLFCFAFNGYAAASNVSNYYDLKKTGDFYCNRENFTNAAIYYARAVRLNRNDADLNKLGLICYLNNDYYNALRAFELSYRYNPNQSTKKKIELIKYQLSKKQENKGINLMQPRETAPPRLHNLVEVKGHLKNEDDVRKFHKILDFIWSDNEGKILLQSVLNARIPIFLWSRMEHSNVETAQFNLSNTTFVGHSELTNQFNNLCVINSINIKEPDIENFQENGSSLSENKSCIMVVVHELCHSARSINYPETKNSQEEELGAYIIGYNLASKILTGHPLTEDNVGETAMWVYNIAFNLPGSPYSELPLKNDFVPKMLRLGIDAPYYYLYCNLDNLKFKGLKDNIELKNYIDKINAEFSENYDTVFTNRFIRNKYNLFINKKGEVAIIRDTNSKFSENQCKENKFNLESAAYQEPFPENYPYVMIPIEFSRYNKKVKIKIQK